MHERFRQPPTAVGVKSTGRRSRFGVRTKPDLRPCMPSTTLRADSAAA
jgi:hypothetical protein